MSSSKFESPGRPTSARRAGALASAARAFRYRVIVPLFRSPHPPEYTARGVAIGMFWGLTPLVGTQSVIVGALWVVARRLRWEFSLIQGLAWTWISNVFTMLPMYYLFYLTGMFLLGDAHEATGYRAFLALWQRGAGADESVGLLGQLLGTVRVLGVPAAIGCLPWAIGGAWLSYAWSYRIVERRRQRRAMRAGASAQGVRTSPA